MVIVDAHQDIAFNEIVLGRNYLESVAAIRDREGPDAEDFATMALPEALAGGVGVVFGTLFAIPENLGIVPVSIGYQTAEDAYAQAHDQLAIYRRLTQDSRMALIETRTGLAELRESWATEKPRVGVVLLMEGADPVRSINDVGAWYADGVRLIGPAWRATRYSGGTSAPGPLTEEGRALLREMERVGIALDTSHMAEQSFWEALDIFQGPVLASHSNCRALVPGPHDDRHLSDEMIKALTARGGVIGVVLFNLFLDSAWRREHGKGAVGLDVVIRHIDRICQIAGDANHVGIGSDFDGGFGSQSIPRELDTIADLPRLADALRGIGYTDEHVAAIMGGNWLRHLETILS